MLSSRVLYRSNILQTLGISSLDSRQQLRVRLALRHGGAREVTPVENPAAKHDMAMFGVEKLIPRV